MKIEKRGKKEWEGKKIECEHCKTKLKLEAGDKVGERTVSEENKGSWLVYSVCCPVCKKRIKFYCEGGKVF